MAGFDIIYSCQDMEFDKRMGLHSIPKRFGIPGALAISLVFHLVTIGLLLLFGYMIEAGFVYFVLLGIISLILLIEHVVVTPNKLGMIGVAFFTLNGIISIIFYVAVFADQMVKGN